MIPSCTLLFSHDQTQVVSLGKEYYRDEVPSQEVISRGGFVLCLFFAVFGFNCFYSYLYLYWASPFVDYCCYTFLYLNMIFFSYLNIFIMIEVLTKSNIREIFLTAFSAPRMSHTFLIPYMAYNFVVAVKSSELI